MSVNNNYFVAQRRTLSFKGRKFKQGNRFPAADLSIDQKAFDSLIKDKALVTGKERNAFVHPESVKPAEAAESKSESSDDILENMSKAELLETARNLELEIDKRASKDEIIAAIKTKV